MENIAIAGRVTRDGEVRSVGTDTVLSFSVAVNKKIKGEKTVRFYDCSLWGDKRARALSQYIKKGENVAVSGEFSTHEHNGKFYCKVRVNELSLLGGSSKSDASDAPATSNNDVDEGLPF